jgi:hypothetical protein
MAEHFLLCLSVTLKKFFKMEIVIFVDSNSFKIVMTYLNLLSSII